MKGQVLDTTRGIGGKKNFNNSYFASILCAVFLTVTGLVAQLPQEFFMFLLEVQNRLAQVIKSVGKIEHSLYPFTAS